MTTHLVQDTGHSAPIIRGVIEAEAIPYEPSLLRGERLLVLAPHPDDEVIACGGLIALHLAEERVVRVVVATDGAAAIDGADDDYRARREAESRSGLAHLGSGEITVEFLRFPDRALAEHAEQLKARMRDELVSFRPDLVLVPSPIEFHPDHYALSEAFCTLIQSDPSLFADLAVARVAFYEVTQPLRPTDLVDITPVANAKYAAVSEHTTQLANRDYVAFARGLNAFRAMTLPADVQCAEAFATFVLPELRTLPISELQHRIGDAYRSVEVIEERAPISVIIRTKDRPALLREAIDSARATGYPAELIVVNDGGARIEGLDENVRLLQHETSRGRSEAANEGVRAASSPFVAFLDDDDLFYPEHLHVLNRAAKGSTGAAWYTDALSVFLRMGESGTYETQSQLRLFGSDFDPDLLLIDNYIPLPTLLIRRHSFLDLGGFDPTFDLFEDWDFLIRLSARGRFVRIPRITCEIRNFEGGSSITMAAPEGSSRFREAKLRVWSKHADRMTNDVIANAFERQKRGNNALLSESVEEKGRRNRAEQDIARLERDKRHLIGEIEALHGRLAAEIETRDQRINERDTRVLQLETDSRSLLDTIHRLHLEIAEWTGKLEFAGRELAEKKIAENALYGEIQRLQSLLDTIYASRTWKMHALMQRMKGNG